MEITLKTPEKIRIATKINGREAPGMFAMLKFVMAKKNSYNLVFGPSDAKGQIEVTRDQILSEARKTKELFLMDYADIESFWTCKLLVTLMSREAIQRALSASRLFRRYEYAPNYEEQLRAADNVLAQTPEAELSVSVLCQPSENIDIESVDA
jgi:hypothetical protein